MCIRDRVKGWRLEDCYGEEWEEKYRQCIEDERIKKRSITIKEIVRMVLKSVSYTHLQKNWHTLRNSLLKQLTLKSQQLVLNYTTKLVQ